MERVNRIIHHPSYKQYVSRIREYECERIFCKHDMVHFLDVCRIAETEWLTNQLAQSNAYVDDSKVRNSSIRVLIYAAGLLHDIGRFEEYEKGIRHEIASVELADAILKDCGFESAEIKEVLTAIRNHRNREIADDNSLSGYIYRGDKRSRACFACEAETECDWPKDKKNLKLI